MKSPPFQQIANTRNSIGVDDSRHRLVVDFTSPLLTYCQLPSRGHVLTTRRVNRGTQRITRLCRRPRKDSVILLLLNFFPQVGLTWLVTPVEIRGACAATSSPRRSGFDVRFFSLLVNHDRPRGRKRTRSLGPR